MYSTIGFKLFFQPQILFSNPEPFVTTGNFFLCENPFLPLLGKARALYREENHEGEQE